MSVAQSSEVKTISAQDLAARLSRGERIELIDVRTPAEYRELHAEIARLVPLDSLDARAVIESRELTVRRRCTWFAVAAIARRRRVRSSTPPASRTS